MQPSIIGRMSPICPEEAEHHERIEHASRRGRWTCLLLAALQLVPPSVGSRAETAGAPHFQSAFLEHDRMTFQKSRNPQANERIELPGFSVAPPQGEDWIEGPRFPEPDPDNFGPQIRLAFIKVVRQAPEYGPHSVFARVVTTFLSEPDQRIAAANVRDFIGFRMRLTMARDKVSAAPRYGLRSQKAELDQSIGYVCWRYDLILEDRGVEKFPDAAFVIDFHSYECIDRSFKLLVTLLYSQRVHQDAKPVDISSEGNKFLKSLKFVERSR